MDLIPTSLDWLNSGEFKQLTGGDASSSKVKVVKRIEYVRDKLTGKL